MTFSDVFRGKSSAGFKDANKSVQEEDSYKPVDLSVHKYERYNPVQDNELKENTDYEFETMTVRADGYLLSGATGSVVWSSLGTLNERESVTIAFEMLDNHAPEWGQWAGGFAFGGTLSDLKQTSALPKHTPPIYQGVYRKGSNYGTFDFEKYLLSARPVVGAFTPVRPRWALSVRKSAQAGAVEFGILGIDGKTYWTGPVVDSYIDFDQPIIPVFWSGSGHAVKVFS